MHQPIQTIKTALEKFPDVKTEFREKLAAVFPKDETGFKVELHVDNSGYTVFYGGWNEHFEKPDDALLAFFFGLTDRCRIRVWSRGGVDYTWELEHKEGAEWKKFNQAGYLSPGLLMFWKKKENRHLQNSLISKRFLKRFLKEMEQDKDKE